MISRYISRYSIDKIILFFQTIVSIVFFPFFIVCLLFKSLVDFIKEWTDIIKQDIKEMKEYNPHFNPKEDE